MHLWVVRGGKVGRSGGEKRKEEGGKSVEAHGKINGGKKRK